MKLGYRLVALAVLAAMVLAPAAAAAPEPGTPVAVAPGVPGNGRTWELVTPEDTVSPQLQKLVAISVTGDRLLYMTLGPLPGAPSGSLFQANLAVRGSDGWASIPLSAPDPETAALLTGGPEALSPDLATSIWPNPLRPEEPSKDLGLYRREPDGGFALLAEIGQGGGLTGTSKDLQHVVFASEKHLLPADASRDEGKSIYEIVGSTLRLVDVAGDGSPISTCGSTVPMANAISGDGQRIYFVPNPSCTGPGRVFLRTGGATTTEISASQCDLEDCGPEAEVSFVGATPSGSSAFLVTEQRLTDDDSDATSDLYRYDVASGALTLLSTQLAGVDEAVVAEPVEVSADGSRAYFRVAQVGAGSEEEALYLAEGGSREVAPRADPLVQLAAGGRFALFSSTAPLVAEDGDEQRDVYRYDAADGSLARISTADPAGGNAPVDAEIAPNSLAEGVASHPYRAMAEDGSRIFFTTAERLLPVDQNDVADVYEWANGNLGLISAGVGDRPTVYLGVTGDGGTAFFRTALTLLPRDRDGGDLDFYAARIDGGFAEPGAAAADCEGDSCRVAPAVRGDRRAAGAAGATRAIKVRHIGAAARRRIVATGWISLLAESPAPGHLSALARAPFGRRSRTVASTAVDVAEAGPVRLRMHLSGPARQRLAQGADLRLRLVLRLSRLKRPLELRVPLEGRR